jgi:hypothetical protein
MGNHSGSGSLSCLIHFTVSLTSSRKDYFNLINVLHESQYLGKLPKFTIRIRLKGLVRRCNAEEILTTFLVQFPFSAVSENSNQHTTNPRQATA